MLLVANSTKNLKLYKFSLYFRRYLLLLHIQFEKIDILMNIPQSDILSTSLLGKIFSNTVVTYKYFWFVSIMQIPAKEDCQVMESHPWLSSVARSCPHYSQTSCRLIFRPYQSRARNDERDASVCESKG